MEFGVLTVLLGLASLASLIWLVVVAFRESVIWGILVFLFQPISAIAFAVYHWDAAKKAFLVYLAVNIIFFALMFNTFTKIGGLEMVETTQQAAKQLEKGEITEVEAAKRVAEQMESSIKRMEETGVIGTEERKALQEKVQELKLDDADKSPQPATTAETEAKSKQAQAQPQAAAVPETGTQAPAVEENRQKPVETTVAAPKATEEKLEFGPDWSLEGALEKKREKFKQQQLDLPEPKLEGRYVPISVSRAEQYVGQQVRVVKEDVRYDGLLKAVNENFMVLDMQVSGGQAYFEVKRHQVHSMYLLTLPDKDKLPVKK